MSDGTNPVVVNGVKDPKKTKKQQRSLKKTLILAGICVVLLLVFLYVGQLLLKTAKNHDIAFEVDHTKYSKKDVAEMVDYELDGSSSKNGKDRRDTVTKSIFDMYKTEKSAQKINIIPNANELKAASKSVGLSSPKTDNQKEVNRLITFNAALDSTYTRYEKGNDEGYFFVFDFSQKILPAPAQETPVAGHGEQQLIDQDKNYASEQAKKYYSDLKDGKISPDNLLKTIQSDTKLGSFYSNGQFSSTKSGALSSQIFYPDIYSYVATQTKPGLSQIRTGRVETKLNPKQEDYADGYYYFVLLQKAGRIVKNPALEVSTEKSRIQAVYYGN